MLKINKSISTVKYIQTTQKTWNLKSNKVAMTEYVQMITRVYMNELAKNIMVIYRVCCMFGYGVKTISD